MSLQAYQSFIDQFCQHAGLAEPRAMYDGAAFRIGATDFMLRHGGARAPEMATVYCALGALPPPGQREAALQRLLESNLYLFGSGSNPCFAFNPDIKQALLTCALWLGEVSGRGLLELLSRFDALANDWRTSYFLCGQEGRTAAPQNVATARLSRSLPPHLARAFSGLNPAA